MALKILIVCDPNLENKIRSLVSALVPDATCICWSKGDKEGRQRLSDTIRSGEWTILFSVYNDYIFSSEELSFVRVPLNLHPALSSCRGVGYDVVPLIEGHSNYGATLHWMTEEVDAGTIIQSEARELCPSWGYAQLRTANQRLTLALFERCLHLWLTAAEVDAFESKLHELAETAQQWSGAYISRRRLSAILEELNSFDSALIDRIELPADFLRSASD